MKVSLNSGLVVLLVVLCMFMVFDTAEAGRKKGRGRGRNRNLCKYQRKGQESACNPATDTKVITLNLKRGDRTSCAATKKVPVACSDNSLTKMKKVKGCRYNRQGAQWSACNAATKQKTKVMTLREGSPTECPPTRTKTKPCNKRKGGRRNRKDCVYQKGPWSECQMNSKQRELVLVEGASDLCQPKKTVTKNCKSKSGCRYKKGDWSACDPESNTMTRPLIPKKRSSPECQAKLQTRRCRRTAELQDVKSDKCRYQLSPWSECDPRSNTMTQWMTLKSGDPNLCIRSKKLSKKCKIACKFRRGEWSECDEKTQLITRVDALVKGNPEHCDLTREITRKCKKVCKYAYGDWGECDPVTNHRTRVKKLLDSGGSDKCKEEEIVTKPCKRKDGGERCFFGAWGDFGPCTNGVMTKHRPVLQGGVICERKAVITKACERPR